MRRALGGAVPAAAGSESDAPQFAPSGRRGLSRAAFSMASDTRLARRAAAGDPEAFAAIFRRYQGDLYRFCVGILREPQDAQDAVQNTMIRAMRALPGERREMQLKPWLYRIAHNEAVELRRRERPVEPLAPTIDDGAATEELVERDAKLKSLLADIADLPERQRAALVMREVNGLGFGEIGDALGTSPGAVRQALYEARRGLSQMELGRDMDCEAAMRQVSDAEGRPRRRGVRAHLRACADCRRFQAEIRGRTGSLASIAPLPALAVAGLLQSALGGSGAGGGATAAGGAGALAGAGGAGAGSGAAALSGGAGAGGAGISGAAGLAGAGASGGAAVLAGAGVSGAVKAGVGLVAAIAVGTAAVDHGALLQRAEHSPNVAEPSHVAGQPPAEGSRPTARALAGSAASPEVGQRHEVRGAAASRGDAVYQASADRAGGPGHSRTIAVGEPSEPSSHATEVGDQTQARRPADHAGDQTGTVGISNSEAGAVVPTAVPVADTSTPASTPTSVAGTRATSAGGPTQTSALPAASSPQAAAHPSAHGEPAPAAEHVIASNNKGGTGGAAAAGTEASPSTHPAHPAHPTHPAHPAGGAQPAAASAPEAAAPLATAPSAEAPEPLPETTTPAPVATAETGNGHGLAKGHAKQTEEAE